MKKIDMVSSLLKFLVYIDKKINNLVIEKKICKVYRDGNNRGY